MPTSLFHPGRTMSLILRDPDTGDDLITLDVCGPNMGAQGISLLTGFSGLYHAPRTPISESHAYQEGATPSDFPRVDPRMIDMRLATRGDTPELWETIDSLLWQVLGFRHDAYLRWYSKGGTQWRELKVRLDRKPTDQMTYDPRITKHMVWDCTLVAYDPWWYSETLTSEWRNDGTGSGTLLLENPADQECWVQFSGGTIEADETWTLPDALGTYPQGHPRAGQQVTHTLPTLTPEHGGFLVDTHPLAPLLTVRNRALPWAEMRAEAFLFSLPPHTTPREVPVSLVGGTPDSYVTAFMTQRWDRPWGGELA